MDKTYQAKEQSLVYPHLSVEWNLIQILADTRIKEVSVLIEMRYVDNETGQYVSDPELWWCLSDAHRKELYTHFTDVVQGESERFDEIMQLKNFVPAR